MNQWWPRLVMHICVTRRQWVNVIDATPVRYQWSYVSFALSHQCYVVTLMCISNPSGNEACLHWGIWYMQLIWEMQHFSVEQWHKIQMHICVSSKNIIEVLQIECCELCLMLIYVFALQIAHSKNRVYLNAQTLMLNINEKEFDDSLELKKKR